MIKEVFERVSGYPVRSIVVGPSDLFKNKHLYLLVEYTAPPPQGNASVGYPIPNDDPREVTPYLVAKAACLAANLPRPDDDEQWVRTSMGV